MADKFRLLPRSNQQHSSLKNKMKEHNESETFQNFRLNLHQRRTSSSRTNENIQREKYGHKPLGEAIENI